MERSVWIPKWQKELTSFKGIKSTFIIEGNISDEYPLFKKEGEDYKIDDFYSLGKVIEHIFNTGETENYYDFLCCDPIFGFSDPLSTNTTRDIVSLYKDKTSKKQEEMDKINGKGLVENHSGKKMVYHSEIIRSSMTEVPNKPTEERKSILNIISFASRFLDSPNQMNIDETTFFLNLLYASHEAKKGNKFKNTMILVVNKLNDIPAWFYYNNPNVRIITIPNPDRNTREAYIDKIYEVFSSSDVSLRQDNAADNEILKAKTKFIDLTEGMKIKELDEMRRLYEKSDIAIEDISDVVAIYKYGFEDNRWAQVRSKLTEDMEKIIKERVKGQKDAIEKIVQIIKRAVVGLSGLQHSSNAKPRGIMFLAGPTGTGKTEIVKAVTQLLFEDEKALIRFDMSEYAAEHADQKLFGAPPGYVGYDNGGQLTNAVKNNPFSVLLFDEIEKAHPNLMDKFLQILEDGRMTDGQGNTVYFTETLMFFTSNVGISREIKDPHTGEVIGRENIVEPGEPYKDIREKVEKAVKTHYKPEVINRIGENIIVFNYIDPTASEEIAKKQIEVINKGILKNNKITVHVGQDALNLIFEKCLQDEARKNGGRGIGNVIEKDYLNTLAEFIYDSNCLPDSEITVSAHNDKLTFNVSRTSVLPEKSAALESGSPESGVPTSETGG
ncbi:MAG: AAA family ATPase [Oscillospiraceae bacterium]|nr:AAA family ATPase [Oscillospiraceae bacterium]